jgi:hypothetical protein
MAAELPLVFFRSVVAKVIILINGCDLQPAVIEPLPPFLRQLPAAAFQPAVPHGLHLPQNFRLRQIPLRAGLQYMSVKSVQLSHNKSFLLMICVLWVFLPRSKAVPRCFFLQKH